MVVDYANYYQKTPQNKTKQNKKPPKQFEILREKNQITLDTK